MPVEATTSNRDQLATLRTRLSRLRTDAAAGRGSSADLADVRSQAITLSKAIDSQSTLSEGDDSASEQAVLVAQNAADLIKLVEGSNGGRRTSAEGPGQRMGGRGLDLSRATPLSAIMAADLDSLDDGGFSGIGEFLGAVRGQLSGVRADERLISYQATGQNRSSDPAGGFLVPDRFQAQIIQSEVDSEPWLALLNSYLVPDGAGDVVMPILADRDRSGEDIGGVELTRTSETGQIPLSTMTFESRRAILSKAGTRIRVSNELLQDNAVGMEGVINSVFAKAVSLRRALDFVGGTGVGEPMGLLTAAATYEQAKETSQASDTIIVANILKMWERLSPAVRSRAAWLSHPSTFSQLMSLTLNVGTAGSALMLVDASQQPRQTLLGAPVYFTEACELLGDKGDLLLFDPQSYLYLNKGLRIDMSRDFRFDYDEAEFRIILRDDGGPLYSSARTDVQGYSNSEYVTLAARA
jgi:HK97 family phage major capsid protein